jgi:hypothetical protein
MAEACYNAKYLVLHFLRGQLESTKITHSWRGALASKRNHERYCDPAIMRRVFKYTEAQIAVLQERNDATSRILPIEAILALKGLERPDTELSEADMAVLKSMGIAE